jgi:hypothetical protein
MVAVSFVKHLDRPLLSAYQSPAGVTLSSLVARKPLLLVFLRHFG